MNGFDATIEIRKMADPKKSNIPIIALTASALFDIKEKVYESGMNDYVSKPFKPEELREKIFALVETV
jgi:CheY-like chemotaxis protein